jgi:hypothetical protein
VSPLDDGGGVELFSDELHVIRGVGRVVWCHVTIPKHTAPAAGAEAARRVADFLIANVIHRRSAWLGLILDARGGPSVFGPITRQVTVKLLESAEAARKAFAVVTAGNTVQHEQYATLAAAHAPRFALVTVDAAQAADWMTRVH